MSTGQAYNEIVSSRGGTCYEQSGDNGQDCRERNRRDEARQDASTNGPRQVDGSQIISAKQRAAGVRIGGVATEDRNAAISDDKQHRKEQGNEARRVENRYTRCSLVTNRKEAH